MHMNILHTILLNMQMKCCSRKGITNRGGLMKDSLNKFRRTLISYYKQQRIGPMIDDITQMVKHSNRMDDAS